MSPEQAQGKPADARSDIFSFGLVLYEMLTGTRAFDGENPTSVIAAILERDAPSVAAVAPPALDRVLRKCLVEGSTWSDGRPARDIQPRDLDRWTIRPPARVHITNPLADAGLRVARRIRHGVGTRRVALDDMAATAGRPTSPELSAHTPSGCRVPILPEWRRKHHLSRWPKRRVRGGHERDAAAMDSGPRFAHRPRASRHRWGQASVLVARQPRDRLFHEQRPAADRRVWSGGGCHSRAQSTREAARGMPTGRLCSVQTLLARFTRSATPAERPHRSPHCRPVKSAIDGRSSCQTVARSSTSWKDNERGVYLTTLDRPGDTKRVFNANPTPRTSRAKATVPDTCSGSPGIR